MKYHQLHTRIVELCLVAETFVEVEAKLGLPSPTVTLRKYIKRNAIPMPVFLGQRAGRKKSSTTRRQCCLGDLRENVILSNGAIKRMLFRDGVKDKKCERCGWCEPRPSDGKIPLHLHHKNGNHLDCRLENLEILCPNHHALTDNYCGCKNRSKGSLAGTRKAQPIPYPRNICEHCGQLGYGDRYCSQQCVKASQRRVARPTVEQLAEDIRTMSWIAIGKKYGVSDNAIRKWARSCGLLPPTV